MRSDSPTRNKRERGRDVGQLNSTRWIAKNMLLFGDINSLGAYANK